MAFTWGVAVIAATAVAAAAVLAALTLLYCCRNRPTRLTELQGVRLMEITSATPLLQAQRAAYAKETAVASDRAAAVPHAASLGAEEDDEHDEEPLVVGTRTVERCREAVRRFDSEPAAASAPASRSPSRVGTIAKLPPRTRLLRLLQLSEGVLATDHDGGALGQEEQCLMQIARLPTLTALFISVNRALDALESATARPEWATPLADEVSSAVRSLSRRLRRSAPAIRATLLSDPSGPADSVVMALFYALQDDGNPAAAMFPPALALVQRAFALVTTLPGAVVVPLALPGWLDPFPLLRNEPEHDFAGKKPRDAWRLGFTDVSVAAVRGGAAGASVERCMRQCALWEGLRHPNVLRLEAAALVGVPRVVCARGTALDAFLRPSASVSFMYLQWARQRQARTWTRLLEAARGLQFLHRRDVVFVGLTTEDLRVVEPAGGPGTAGQPATGRSCQVSCLHAVSLRWPQEAVAAFHGDAAWLAPERQAGGAVSKAADVFSFGLCVLHAVTGDAPRVAFDADGAVRDEAASPRGGGVDSADAGAGRERQARQLVREMCVRDPERRVSIEHVVSELERLAESEGGPEASADAPKTAPDPSLASLAALTLRDGSGFMDALASARSLCDRSEPQLSPTVATLSRGVLDRVEAIVRCVGYTRIPSDTAEQLADVVSRLHALLRPASPSWSAASTSTSTLSLSLSVASGRASVVATRRSLGVLRSLHRQLDRVVAALEGLGLDPGELHTWVLPPAAPVVDPTEDGAPLPILPLDRQNADADADEQLALLQFELQRHASSYPPGVVAKIRAAVERLERVVDARPPLPSWFLPAYEVELDDLDAFVRGGVGSVHRGRWLDTRVVVKKDEERSADGPAELERELGVWSALRHRNVLRLYGACHLRGQRFFVCELAPDGALDAYLKRASPARTRGETVWRLLSGVARGLEYLHSRGVAHGALRCRHVLVGADETPKLAGFGRGFGWGGAADGAAEGALHASRWAAPEVLRAEASASCAADVFSLGMAVVEAVTGEPPWGRALPDAAVALLVASGQLPPRPVRRARTVRSAVAAGVLEGGEGEGEGEAMADDEWALVRRLCAFEPSERLPLPDASARMLQLALQRAQE